MSIKVFGGIFLFCLRVCVAILFSVGISTALYSQNLIPNPSFEDPINFKDTTILGWHRVQDSDTPDYFNFGDNSKKNIFDTYIGGTKPKTGAGIIGIFVYRVSPTRNIRNVREFIESPLVRQLERDSLYRIEISLCLDSESNVIIRNFGILFSSSSISAHEDIKLSTLNPQIDFSSFSIDNSGTWITLQSFYKSKGNEKFISIGNFKPDKLTIVKRITPANEKGKKKKWNLDDREKASYYYIDDIVVEKVPVMNPVETIRNETRELLTDTFDISKIKLDSAIILKNIIFEFNKSDLLPQSYAELNKLHHLMISNPGIKVKLEGHTDNFGTYEFNLNLSLKRAESVANYLLHKGIEPERIKTAGYSFSYPIVSNETEEGRQINRRVSFVIIEK